MTLSVAYVLKQYPRLSETFILNEILGLEANDIDVEIHSLRPASEGRFHPALAEVAAPVHYVPTAIDRSGYLNSIDSLVQVGTDGLAAATDFLNLIPADRRSRLLFQAVDVAGEVTGRRVDHLHAHFLTVASHTCHLVHLLTGIPYSVTAHAKDIYRTTVDWDLATVIGENASAVITVCDANARHLEGRLGATSIHRIYNGIAPQDAPVPASARPDDLILGVGRLVPKKGFDHLLRAVAELRDQGRWVRARILGEGDCRESLEQLARELGIADRIEFYGACTQDVVAEQMRQATVLVAPCVVGPDGNQDALPTVLVESLAAGLPVVSTDIAGVPEIIEHGVHGRIVPTVAGGLDNARLTAEIANLIDDASTRRDMSEAGPLRFRQRFDRSATTRELADLLARFPARRVAA